MLCFISLSSERGGAILGETKRWERGKAVVPPEQKDMEEESPLQEAFRQSSELSVIKDH